MSLGPHLKSIDCTACGAGLDILGGGRVTVHICPYCGTALDALDSDPLFIFGAAACAAPWRDSDHLQERREAEPRTRSESPLEMRAPLTALSL